MKLPPGTGWLKDEDVRAVCKSLGNTVYFVGGCVRDVLLDRDGSDVDMSTPLRPEEVKARAEAAGLKVVPTGLDHGTVTVVAGGKGFEVTTFRKDVSTDGRRAVVSFTDDMAEDAIRRDFTLNALYATPDGRVIDPLGQGLRDCLDRRIRFIEDAERRIREDYLRILRYFRFFACYADPAAGFDPEALNAIAQNVDGLDGLSAERIGAEMKKLLAAPDPAPAISGMTHTGCLAHVLPGSDDRMLGPVIHMAAELDLAPDAILRLAALGGENVAERLRLSRADARYLAALQQRSSGDQTPAEIAYRDGLQIARGVALLRAAASNAPLAQDSLPALAKAAAAVFPVRAKDLMPAFSGPALGAELARLENRWIASGFSLGREELMTED